VVVACDAAKAALGHHIIRVWPTALRVRASHVRSVELGLSSDSRPKVGRTRKSSEQAAPCQSVGRNLNSKWGRRDFSTFLCRFSSAATSIGLKYPDRQKEQSNLSDNILWFSHCVALRRRLLATVVVPPWATLPSVVAIP